VSWTKDRLSHAIAQQVLYFSFTVLAPLFETVYAVVQAVRAAEPGVAPLASAFADLMRISREPRRSGHRAYPYYRRFLIPSRSASYCKVTASQEYASRTRARATSRSASAREGWSTSSCSNSASESSLPGL
jgi:hypothetical protein